MAVGLDQPGDLSAVAGVRLGTTRAGIKASSAKDDLVVLELSEGSQVAGVFTKNRFCAAPVHLAKRHLAEQHGIRYLLINSGNANAGTGQQGEANALASCEALAELVEGAATSVLPFSTGVIGQQLPVDKISAALPAAIDNLAADNWLQAAKGIMTTDTIPKAITRTLQVDGKSITITGMSKGSGMIKPDMATMLGYVATDADVASAELQLCLNAAVDESFNCITVDGDTSTNDSCILVATGQSGVKVDSHHAEFIDALKAVFQHLAHAIVRDGEGATKFVEIAVSGAASVDDAKSIGYTIAHSPLVKTALFASDANWGRILAAIGRAPVAAFDINRVNLFLGDVCLIRGGLPDSEYSEAKGQAVISQQDIVIRVEMGLGDSSATVWTTDLSYDYVKINAEYRS